MGQDHSLSYRTPSHRAAAVNQVRNVLLASRKAVLTTHLNADGDGAGSEAALAAWLRANGTEAWIVNPTTFPDTFRFLIEQQDWVVSAGSARARDICDSADLAIVLDTGEFPRIGRVQEMIRHLPTVVIDHHPIGDHAIGGTALRDVTACATGELVHDIIHEANGPWTSHIDQGIYIAILTDTGGFRFDNASAGCHRVVSEVIDRGVDPEAMHESVFGSARIRRYHLLKYALESLEFDPVHGISWMIIPRDRYEEVEASSDDLEGFVDIPRSITGTEVALLFRTTASGDVKISFRSNGTVDVNVLARMFKGGGHVKASGAVTPGPMEDAVARVLDAARDAVGRARATS